MRWMCIRSSWSPRVSATRAAARGWWLASSPLYDRLSSTNSMPPAVPARRPGCGHPVVPHCREGDTLPRGGRCAGRVRRPLDVIGGIISPCPHASACGRPRAESVREVAGRGRGQLRGDPSVAGWCIIFVDGPRASMGMSAGECQGSTHLIHHPRLGYRYQRHAYTIKPRLVNV